MMRLLVKRVHRDEDAYILLDENQIQDMAYITKPRYKLSEALTDTQLEELNFWAQENIIQDSGDLETFFHEFGMDTTVSLCNNYEKWDNISIIWEEDATWMQSTIENEWDSIQVLEHYDGRKWVYYELENTDDAISWEKDSLTWESLDEWDGRNWCFNKNQHYHAKLARLPWDNDVIYLIKEWDEYQGSFVTVQVFNTITEVRNWFTENEYTPDGQVEDFIKECIELDEEL